MGLWLAEKAVDGYIKEGIFNKDDRDELLEEAKKDIDAFNSLASKIQKPVAKIPNLTEGGSPKKTGEESDEWTIKDWQKNDPNGLLNMLKNDPERYKELYKNTYKVEPKI